MLYINSSYFSDDNSYKNKSLIHQPLFLFHLRRKLIALLTLAFFQFCIRMIFNPYEIPENKWLILLSLIPISFISILQARRLPLSHPVSLNKVPILLIKIMKFLFRAYIHILLTVFYLYLSFGWNIIFTFLLFTLDSSLVYTNHSTTTQIRLYKRPVCSVLGKRNGKLLLGCPIAFKIDAVTGKIKLIQIHFQIISNKAFFKKMKKEIEVNKVKYNYWMPLYLGKKKHELKQKTLHVLKSSLIYFKNSASSRVKYQTTEQLILTIFPKIITQILYCMANNPYGYISQQFTFVLYFFYQYQMLLQQFPDLQTLAAQRVQNFIDNQKHRHKSSLDSLGDMLSLCLLSRQFRFDSEMGKTFLDLYLKEQYDRNVYWILQKYPNLQKLDNQADFQRVQQAFDLKIKSYRLVMMAFLLEKNVFIVNQVKDPFQMSNILLHQYKANVAKDLCSLVQNQISLINRMYQFKQFYRFVDLNPPSRDQYITQLKNAVNRSKLKGYHGDGIQIDNIDDNYSNIQNNEQFKMKENKQIQPQTALFMQQIQKDPQPIAFFYKLKLIYNNIDTITIKDLIMLQEEIYIGRVDKFKLIIQLSYISQKYSQHTRLENYSDILPSFEQSYYREILWNFLFEFSKNPNFQLFYNFTQALGSKSRALDIIVLQKYALKSNYYYIQQMFSRFSRINFISLQRYKFLPNNIVPSSLLKFFSRGLENYTNMIKQQHRNDESYQVSVLVFKDIQFQQDIETQKHFYRIFKLLQESHRIKVIVLNKVILPSSLIKILSSSMNKMPHVQILGLQMMNLQHQNMNNIADSLFMLKKLQFLNLQGSYHIDDSIASLLNNISFLKNLQSLKLNNTVANIKHHDDICENLSKILKIGPSI